MSYFPHTDNERREMLDTIGVNSIEDLFDAVPADKRFPNLDLPEALSEMAAADLLRALSEANDSVDDYVCFRGAGAYHHFVPSAVNHLLLRGEFYTAYTPYQPEMSQGTLQALYEYQSMMSALTAMDAANASHYDGATSLAEAVTMAMELTRHKRHEVLLSHALHPHYREVVRTYQQWRDVEIGGDEGTDDLETLASRVTENTALVAVGYPNFFGHIEDLSALASRVHEMGALLCVVTNPVALGLLKPPGEFGADIVVGEGQPLGVPLSFGGPYAGFFATRTKYVRKIAGRIVGETVDADDNRAFTMTLRPREQDIRREKATSNICTNQGLMTLASGVYLSLLGKNGLRKVAELCYHRAHYAADQIDALPGYSVDRSKTFFHEFVVNCPRPVSEINAALIETGIVGGYDLGKDYPHLDRHMLLCVTEMNSKGEIDGLVDVLREVQ